MLISNTSKIVRTIHLHLRYDDHTEKEGDIGVGTKMYLSFRRNHNVEVKYGVINDIIDKIFYRLSNVEGEDRQSEACIVFDMSRPYESNVCTIPLSDIIDFEIIPEGYEGINPDHKVPFKIYEDLCKE